MSLPVHWVNTERGAGLNIRDRSFLFGDSLFETLRYHHGQYHLLEYHLQRLRRGCEVLGISFEDARVRAQLAQGGDYLTRAGIAEACARLTLSRGDSERGYSGHCEHSNLVLGFSEVAPWRSIPAPAQLICCEVVLAEQPRLAGIKHGNRLEQVLAAREVAQAGADEGFMLNTRGEIICAVAANVFVVFGDSLLTPALTECGIAGTVRRLVMEELAPVVGIACTEERIPWADLQQADEVFLTNSLFGIRSVATCPGRCFTSTRLGDTLRDNFFAWSERPCP